MLAVELHDSVGRGVDPCQSFPVGCGEQPPFDDLEGLFGIGGLPLVGNPSHDVLQPAQCFAAVLAADFFLADVVVAVGVPG